MYQAEYSDDAAASSAPGAVKIDGVEEMRSLAHQAAKIGFVVGAYVSKKKEETVRTYRVDRIGDDTCEVVECVVPHLVQSVLELYHDCECIMIWVS